MIPTDTDERTQQRGGRQTRTVRFDDNGLMRELVGEFGSHLKLLASAFDVSVEQRGNEIRVAGEDEEQADLVVRLLGELGALARRGHGLQTSDVEHGIRILKSDPDASLVDYFEDAIVVNVEGRPICARSAGQREYVRALRAHDLVFGLGPAGTGKTYLA
ncbi:MAG: PhoH family protein, partial [Myxococcales bacterium]|nr:PhoH family protein [Myxococcales bacterium]